MELAPYNAESAKKTDAPPATDTMEWDGGSILAIDDDAVSLSLLQDLLELNGYKVTTASDGPEGIASFSAQRHSLILTDVRMPCMNGIEVLRRIREIDQLAPVVIITGHGDLDIAIDSIRDGAFDFLQKPLNPELLLKTVRQGMEHHRLRVLEKEHTRLLEEQVAERTRELAQTNDFLKGILDSSTAVSIILTDFDRNILFWNPGAERIFGYTAHEMTGEKITRLYRNNNLNLRASESVQRMLRDKHGTVHSQVEQVAKDGRVLTISLTVAPMLEASGEVKGILGLGQDVTEEVRLNQELRRSYERIKRMQGSSIFALAKLAESRDGETGDHLKRIQEYCLVLCSELRNRGKTKAVMTDQFVEDLVQSCVLHDIGKVVLPDAILFHPGKFGEDEYEAMKRHALYGGKALEEASAEAGEAGFLSMGRDVAYYHHEHWNGMGYPFGLEGEEIPLAARIVAIVDVYDALTSERRYKRAYGHQEACSIIMENRGEQFDPDLVDAFMRVEHLFRKIRRSASQQNGRTSDRVANDPPRVTSSP